MLRFQSENVKYNDIVLSENFKDCGVKHLQLLYYVLFEVNSRMKTIYN